MPEQRSSSTATRLLAVEERLAAVEARHQANAVLIKEIHVAVIGNGSAGSSLRERVSSLETSREHQSSLRYRGVSTAATAIVSAGLAYLAHALGGARG